MQTGEQKHSKLRTQHAGHWQTWKTCIMITVKKHQHFKPKMICHQHFSNTKHGPDKSPSLEQITHMKTRMQGTQDKVDLLLSSTAGSATPDLEPLSFSFFARTSSCRSAMFSMADTVIALCSWETWFSSIRHLTSRSFTYDFFLARDWDADSLFLSNLEVYIQLQIREFRAGCINKSIAKQMSR
jgi:hypothetical protein